MKKAILGTKVGMTQLFQKDGTVVPVTVVEAGPCTVVQVKSVEKDGYKAIQVGFKTLPESRVKKLKNKPEQGHFKKAGVAPTRYLRELRLEDAEKYEVGQQIQVDVFSEDFSAFVFKIQANMNKAHRDRIAFMRLVSGRFDADKEVYHVQGGKKLKLSRPQQLMAAEREIIEEAYAGDIIGVFDPGIFSIGDTVTVPGKKFKFSGIPTFAPEHFARVSAKDSMKRKQFVKGTAQIAQEGAIQIFKVPGSGMEEVIVGVVGVLQFDVFQYRMKNEYGVELRMDHLPYEELRLIDSYPGDLQDLNLGSDAELLEDYRDRKLLVFTSFWAIDFTCRRNPGLQLSEITVDQDAGEA